MEPTYKAAVSTDGISLGQVIRIPLETYPGMRYIALVKEKAVTMLFTVPHPTASNLGPRKEIGMTLAPNQLALVLQAREAGVSKQALLTRGLAVISEEDLATVQADGTGRKFLKVRAAPEVVMHLEAFATKHKAPWGQVLAACAKALLQVTNLGTSQP